MLVQRTSGHDVEPLHPAANAQHRHFLLHRRRQDRPFIRLAGTGFNLGVRICCGAIARGSMSPSLPMTISASIF